MSQPPNTMSSRRARGTRSAMRGARFSVRLPRRTVPIWVRLPMGRERPLRMASTPAMNVVATAPMPGSSTPSFPSAGAIGRPPSLLVLMGRSPPQADVIRLPKKGDATTIGERAPPGSAQGGLYASGAGEELQGGRGQLAVMARPHEALLAEMVVEDPGAGEVLLRVEGIEHEDPRVAREAAVVEEPEMEIAHRHVRLVPFEKSPGWIGW